MVENISRLSDGKSLQYVSTRLKLPKPHAVGVRDDHSARATIYTSIPCDPFTGLYVG